jgi:hypothetical protein
MIYTALMMIFTNFLAGVLSAMAIYVTYRQFIAPINCHGVKVTPLFEEGSTSLTSSPAQLNSTRST